MHALAVGVPATLPVARLIVKAAGHRRGAVVGEGAVGHHQVGQRAAGLDEDVMDVGVGDVEIVEGGDVAGVAGQFEQIDIALAIARGRVAVAGDVEVAQHQAVELCH